MLHKKIQLTIGLIDDVVDNRQKEKNNADTAKRNSTFFDSFATLTPSIRSFLIAKKNFSFSLQSNTADNLRDLMDYSKTTFNNAKVVNPGLFKQKAESFVETIAKEWEAFYKANNSELINSLNIIALVHPTPTVVKSCITAFNKCEKWPLTQKSVDSYKEARQKADVLLNEMKFDDEILYFLIKVYEGEATLTDITPSIMEWIQSKNIADKVNLSIGNTM